MFIQISKIRNARPLLVKVFFFLFLLKDFNISSTTGWLRFISTHKESPKCVYSIIYSSELNKYRHTVNTTGLMMRWDTWIREAKGQCVQLLLALPTSLLLPSTLSPFSPVCLFSFPAHVPITCFMVSSAFHAKMSQIDVSRPLCLFWVTRCSHSASQLHSLPVSCSTQPIIM